MLQAEAIVYIHTLFDVYVCVVARCMVYPNVTALPLEGLFVKGERDVWKRRGCSLIPRPSPFLFLSLQTEEWIVLNAN